MSIPPGPWRFKLAATVIPAVPPPTIKTLWCVVPAIMALREGCRRAEPEVRIHLPPADSLSLSRSRFRRSRTRLSARVWAAGLAIGVGRDARVFRYRTNWRQYLCRAEFQYRSEADVVARLPRRSQRSRAELNVRIPMASSPTPSRAAIQARRRS